MYLYTYQYHHPCLSMIYKPHHPFMYRCIHLIIHLSAPLCICISINVLICLSNYLCMNVSTYHPSNVPMHVIYLLYVYISPSMYLPSVCLSYSSSMYHKYPSIWPSISICIDLLIQLYICISLYLCINLTIHLSIYDLWVIYLCISICIYSMYQSINPSIYLFMSLWDYNLTCLSIALSL